MRAASRRKRYTSSAARASQFASACPASVRIALMKTLKYVLFGVGALIALMVIAVIVIALTFDPNQYKPQIIQAVKDKTGRTLAIAGDLKLKLFPKIGAELGHTSLSERNSDKTFASVNNVQVYVALLPLLSKSVVVDEVRLDGLTAHLIKFKDGTTNFSDLAGAKS